MTTTEQIPKTYEEAVKTLARWQGEGGEPDLRIYVFPDPEKKVVRLLDVSDGFADRGDPHLQDGGVGRITVQERNRTCCAPLFGKAL